MKVEFFLGVALLVFLLVGGGMGTLSSIRSSRGPRERRFVTRVCSLLWAMFLVFLVLAIVLPSPWRWIAGAAFVVLVPAMIYRWSTRRQLIRIVEERAKDRSPAGQAAPPPASQRPG